jgi:hypothetical protein
MTATGFKNMLVPGKRGEGSRELGRLGCADYKSNTRLAEQSLATS